MCVPAISTFVPTADDVKRIVAYTFRLRISDFASPSRRSHVAWARHVAVYLVRETLELSFPRTAICFRRHHSTMISSCNRVLARMAKEPQFAAMVERLKRECRT